MPTRVDIIALVALLHKMGIRATKHKANKYKHIFRKRAIYLVALLHKMGIRATKHKANKYKHIFRKRAIYLVALLHKMSIRLAPLCLLEST